MNCAGFQQRKINAGVACDRVFSLDKAFGHRDVGGADLQFSSQIEPALGGFEGLIPSVAIGDEGLRSTEERVAVETAGVEVVEGFAVVSRDFDENTSAESYDLVVDAGSVYDGDPVSKADSKKDVANGWGTLIGAGGELDFSAVVHGLELVAVVADRGIRGIIGRPGREEAGRFSEGARFDGLQCGAQSSGSVVGSSARQRDASCQFMLQGQGQNG